MRNHLEQIDLLRNDFYGVRHGKSKANDDEVIIGSPINGIGNYGLVEEGRIQVKTSALEAKQTNLFKNKPILILASPFSRTEETAEEVCDVFGIPRKKIIFQPREQERNFGNYENTSNKNYPLVWKKDQEDPWHTDDNVESAISVQDRMTSLVRDIESVCMGFAVLLVSHGDPLQILETAFRRIDVSNHRSLPPLQTGEIRQLLLAPR